jgi:hypothetical protein
LVLTKNYFPHAFKNRFNFAFDYPLFDRFQTKFGVHFPLAFFANSFHKTSAQRRLFDSPRIPGAWCILVWEIGTRITKITLSSRSGATANKNYSLIFTTEILVFGYADPPRSV